MKSKRVEYAEKAKHLEWMRYACRLSWNASPVKDAYCVGCVIVEPSSNRLVTSGFSREMEGNTHAEECALRKLKHIETTKDEKLDMYATMEPCSIRLSGNRPCVQSIMLSGRIGRIFIGIMEPSTLVKCTGTQKLLSAGLDMFIVRDPSNPSLIRDLCLDPNRHITENMKIRVRPRRDEENVKMLSSCSDDDDGLMIYVAEPIQPVKIKTMSSKEVSKRVEICAAVALRVKGKEAHVVEISLSSKLPDKETTRLELLSTTQAFLRNNTKIIADEYE